jgi:hypothetical protein
VQGGGVVKWAECPECPKLQFVVEIRFIANLFDGRVTTRQTHIGHLIRHRSETRTAHELCVLCQHATLVG